MRLCHWLPPVLLVKGKEPQVRVIIEVETTGADYREVVDCVKANLGALGFRDPDTFLVDGQLHVTPKVWAGALVVLWHAKFVWCGK